MRGGDVRHIEGRVLAHQDDIDAAQIELFESTETVMIALPPHDFERPRTGIEPAVVKRQRVRQVMEQGVPSHLCLEGESKSRIRIDVYRIDRIHLDRDGESHASLLGTSA
jgi:hypothetical protein